MTPSPQRSETLGPPTRVIELTGGPAGGYAGRLLATHGIEVIKVEPPGGGGYRALGAFAGDDPHPDRALLSLFLDCSKKSVVLDLATADGRGILDRLLSGADGVIVAPDSWPDSGLEVERIRGDHRHLVVTSITPWGLDGPYVELPSCPLVLEAMCGWLYQTGAPGEEPVRIRGELASALIPGLYAAIGTLAALRSNGRPGEGQLVEISSFETMVAANRYFETHVAQFGEHIGRSGSMLYPYYGYAEAADGWTAPCAVTARHVSLLAELMGTASTPDQADIHRWLATQRREDLFHAGQAKGIPWGYLTAAPEVLELEQLRARGSFVQLDHPLVGSIHVPTTAARQSITGANVDRSPLLGEHTGELPELTASTGNSRPAAERDRQPRLPLAGVRVVDITSWWAGPMAAMILADLGAEVIKVESIQKMDAWRTTLADTSSDTPWETSPLYNSANRNKLGLTLDLTDQRGAALLRDLVARSDVLIENLQPKVLPSLGLDYDTLRQHNQELIMVSQSGFGQTGPWRHYTSLAQVGESLAGIGLLTGHPDGPPMLAGHFIGDTLSATHAAFATLAALRERDRTGNGQHVDLSQLESALPVTAEALLDFQTNGRTWDRIGNHHPFMAPHGCYPTLIDDQWLVLAVADDDEWRRLAALIDEPWARDTRFGTTPGRLAAADELHDLLLGWFVPQERDDVVVALRSAGLRAGPVTNPVEVLADPHLAARAFFEVVDRDIVGPLPYPTVGIRFSPAPAPVERPAPLLGEHNHQVLSSILGLDDPSIDDLHRAGVIGSIPISPPVPITLNN